MIIYFFFTETNYNQKKLWVQLKVNDNYVKWKPTVSNLTEVIMEAFEYFMRYFPWWNDPNHLKNKNTTGHTVIEIKNRHAFD